MSPDLRPRTSRLSHVGLSLSATMERKEWGRKIHIAKWQREHLHRRWEAWDSTDNRQEGLVTAMRHRRTSQGDNEDSNLAMAIVDLAVGHLLPYKLPKRYACINTEVKAQCVRSGGTDGLSPNESAR
jgi:hypothetical protein